MATKHIFDVFQITHKYQKDDNEIRRVIRWSIRNTGTQTINIRNFDENGDKRLGKEEYTTYMQTLDIAIRQVMSVGWYDAFKKITEDADAWVVYAFSKKLDMRKHVDAFFWEDLMWDLFEVDKSTLEKWKSEKFDITSSESWSNLCGVTIMTLGNDGIDMLRTLANMWSGAILAPRYLTYRATLLNGTSSEKAEAEINISQLVSGNPSLWILELLWEKWWESVKTVAQNMFTWESTLGNIAWSLSTILLLLWW
jgi:hypothetical protein